MPILMRKSQYWRVAEILGLLFYKIVLDIGFATFCCGVYSYVSTFYIDISVLKMIESWGLYFVLISLTKRNKKTVSAYYMLLQLVLMIAPMLTIYGLSNRPRIFLYSVCCAHCMQCILLEHMPNFKITYFKDGKRVIHISCMFFSIVTIAMILKKYGFPGFEALDNSRVYEIRAKNAMFFPLSYFVPWLISVIIPFILVYALEKKKYVHITGVFFLILFVYLTFAHKSYFFSIFLVLAVYYFLKKGWFVKGVCMGIPLGVAGSLLIYSMNKNLLIVPSLIVRRVLIVPADIKFAYYEFFSEIPKLYFSEGIIGRLFGLEYPYQESSARMIGNYMGDGSSANGGYFADAYANMGILGIFIMGFILILLLKMIDSVSKSECMVRLNFCIIVFLLYRLNDGALLTTLLTGGMMFAILFFIISNERKSQEMLPLEGK